MRLLLVMLKEPIAGQVKTRLAIDVGNEKSAQYYQAIVEVLLKQLQGLENCRIRFCYTPDDAGDAVRFWLLPKLKATLSVKEPNLFVIPTAGTQEQEIDFRPQIGQTLTERVSAACREGFDHGFTEIAAIRSDCPECGARWINAAFATLHGANKQHKVSLVTGQCRNDKAEHPYLSALSDITALDSDSEPHTITLPTLDALIDTPSWHALRESPLGAAIKKSLGEEIEGTEVLDNITVSSEASLHPLKHIADPTP